eukprot:gene205-270_t
MKHLFRAFITYLFKWSGWTLVGDLPPGLHKAVMVVGPHTSNWDAWYGLVSLVGIKNIKIKFAIKKEALFFPLSLLLKYFGAIPIERGHSKGLKQVTVLTEAFQNTSEMLLVIAPEGTRKYAPRWKTGFYYVALKAQVPIVLGYLDYAKKEAGFGPVIYPSGDLEKDVQQMKDFFKEKTGKYPQQGIRAALSASKLRGNQVEM